MSDFKAKMEGKGREGRGREGEGNVGGKEGTGEGKV